MSQAPPRSATVADLYEVEGKAELIAGRIVRFMPNGRRHGFCSEFLYKRIDEFARSSNRGEAHADSIGFVVPELTSGRETFSPDASYYEGPFPADDEDFMPGPPLFAVEVRGKSDYGDAAERNMAAKRADYFEAGTLVVWDVIPQLRQVRVYRPTKPDRPRRFFTRRGGRRRTGAAGRASRCDEVIRLTAACRSNPCSAADARNPIGARSR